MLHFLQGYLQNLDNQAWWVLSSIISKSQGTFVPGQKIQNHILLAVELIKGYSRKDGTPRCMMQLDLQKSYDLVDWYALESILKEVGLPNKFIRCIMTTVTTVSYRYNINGGLHCKNGS